jgi:uncharacterized protein YgfB (UPF0149 family)
MRFWSKTTKAKADSRVAKMETPALTGWMETTLMGLGASYDSWRYRNGPKQEVSEALTIIASIWDELERRDVD